MKLSLYNIEQEYLALTQEIMDNGGEATPEQEEALRINEQNLQTKAINYGFVIKQLGAEEEMIDSEISRLKALKESRAKAANKLKGMISEAMQMYGVDEVKIATLKINFRKSESIEVENIDMLDGRYKVAKTTVSADKAAIKEAIKSGETVTGAVLLTNKNLQIK